MKTRVIAVCPLNGVAMQWLPLSRGVWSKRGALSWGDSDFDPEATDTCEVSEESIVQTFENLDAARAAVRDPKGGMTYIVVRTPDDNAEFCTIAYLREQGVPDEMIGAQPASSFSPR